MSKEKRSLSVIFAAWLVVLFAVNVFSSVRPLGDVVKVTGRGEGSVTFTMSSGAIGSVELLTDGIIRFRISPKGKFDIDPQYAIDPSFRPSIPKSWQNLTKNKILIDSVACCRIEIGRYPFSLTIFDASGNVIVRSDDRHPIEFDPESGEVKASFMRSSQVETYYGFGEKAFPEMSRDGKFIVNWNTDTFAYAVGTDPIYQSIPFFYALSQGKTYGLFLNNTYRTWFDMGRSDPEVYSLGAAGGDLDLYIFPGGKQRSPKNVIENYTKLTGRASLPPIWALGFQQSRWSYASESKVREIAAAFREKKIPADVIYFDIDHMDGFRVFTWDKTKFPDPKRLIAELKAKGFRSVVIVDPGIKVDPDFELYADGKGQGIFTKNADGSELNREVWPGRSAFPDFTDPKAREWFGAKYQESVAKGIAGFWNDMNEPGVSIDAAAPKPDTVFHPDRTFALDTPHKGDGIKGDHRRYHNVYGMQMARSSFEGLKRLDPLHRPFVLTRAGFSGVQRYSAVWTGDNVSSWAHLELTIPMLTNLAVSGVAFSGADVGGFQDMPTAELYTRWLQAAVFSPFFRAHSVGWVGDKEPWSFGERYTEINRKSIELRYQFLPYIYSLFYLHEKRGEPIIRPLWYEFPADTGTYLNADEFMVGEDLLVAPVIKMGDQPRGVYLPKGAEWIDWWTGERLETGKMHYPKFPLERLPIYIRAGAIIPTQNVIQHTGEMASSSITLNVGAGIADGLTRESIMFEDAGDGYGYRNGEYSITKFIHSKGVIKIERSGPLKGQRITNVVIHGMGERPRRITADGRDVVFDLDEATKQLKFTLNGDERELRMER